MASTSTCPQVTSVPGDAEPEQVAVDRGPDLELASTRMSPLVVEL